MQPFLAMITPLSQPGTPPGIWGGGNQPFPTPPIANAPGIPGYNPNPPGIWGPPSGFPTPPIANAPGIPGYNPNPPGIWGPPGPWPTPPIHIPGPPPDVGEKPTQPPVNGVWVMAYVPQYQSWVWAYIEPPNEPKE